MRETLEKDGKVWYNKYYIQQEIEAAYKAGLMNGLRVEYHTVTIEGEDNENQVVNNIKKKLAEMFHKDYVEGRVWREGPVYRFTSHNTEW